MRNPLTLRTFLIVVACSLATHTIHAADWTQFRGPNGAGISADSNVPLTWSDTENLRWKIELPGPGSSSPIVLGDRIFVTCYSGYGVPKASGGDIKSLQRHLVCVSRADGTIQWTKTVPGELPEDGYQGYISEHGYASSTPVTDGERVYCFFGKCGVVAFDLDGKQLWQTGVGKESGNRRWGSGASLILYKDSVIVNASEESQSVRALDKLTGKEQWKAAASTLELAYGTPSLVTLKDDRTELVIAVPGEVWGLNPDTGKLQWFAEHQLTGNICPSIIADGETVFVFGGFRSAGSLALRAGGKGDVSKSQVQWSSRNSSYVATPVLHAGISIGSATPAKRCASTRSRASWSIANESANSMRAVARCMPHRSSRTGRCTCRVAGTECSCSPRNPSTKCWLRIASPETTAISTQRRPSAMATCS